MDALYLQFAINFKVAWKVALTKVKQGLKLSLFFNPLLLDAFLGEAPPESETSMIYNCHAKGRGLRFHSV